ncbi:hypothetical protein [Terrarubrum flagellatum]|uniref:hypothetical protein n=1 Tax=Terrirubrum flagellatum TaxID=2895980 RepID=UPI003145110B
MPRRSLAAGPAMRLKPAVSQEEAYRLLALNAAAIWGVQEAALLDDNLKLIADAMATVSALNIPDDVEPLFGQDIAADGTLA